MVARKIPELLALPGSAGHLHFNPVELVCAMKLRAARKPNLYDLARLIRNQGMRPEEVVSLRKEDIYLGRGRLLG
jgi:integrase